VPAVVWLLPTLTYVPYGFSLPAEIPKADRKHCEKRGLMDRIPEVFKEPRIEVDKQKSKSEATKYAFISSKPVPDCGYRHSAKKYGPVKEFILPHFLPVGQMSPVVIN
jgi:hypothetical protein